MPERNKYRFSIEGKPLYPHIKLTREPFPRVLATRIIANDDAEYFGAFLNRTNARMLLDFLNRTFRLRSCDIEIDGSFNYPCTMHYKRRCVAPCVRGLTTVEEYEEIVGLVRLFLLNDRPLFGSVLSSKIAGASEDLDFETAAKWRDILKAVRSYWDNSRRSVWLDATSDAITYRLTEAGLDVILISQKGRRVLGERIFSFEHAAESDAEEAISDIIQQFYRFHAPKEIRVSVLLPNRSELEKIFRERVGRKVRIVLLNDKNRKVSTELAVYRSSAELDVNRLVTKLTPPKLLQLLKREFKLPQTPRRITAIDVSHISGTDQVAAAVSWVDGRMDGGCSQYWLSDASSELGSVRKFVELVGDSRKDGEPELLLVDGGPAQLGMAMAANLPGNISLISAVKPSGEHDSIAYFLAGKRRIAFDISNETHRLLLRLRDEAHDYANAVHRDTRDYANYYRIAEMLPSLTEPQRTALKINAGSAAAIERISEAKLRKLLGEERAAQAVQDLSRYRSGGSLRVSPLVVPTRIQEENGAADDLRPIEADASIKNSRPR